MSVFPTKILLATDGSEATEQATEAAVDLSNRSGSELHVVHVWHDVPGPYAHKFVRGELRRQGQEILDEQVREIEENGATVAKAHLRGDAPPTRSSSWAMNLKPACWWWGAVGCEA